MAARSALISGASIAGPVLAFWLCRTGWDVTVVESAPRLRTGGFAVDIRSCAVDVVRRMGVHSAVLAAQHEHVPIALLSQDGDPIGTVELGQRPDDVIEIARGALSDILYRAGAGQARYIFDDSVAALTQTDAGVDVTFARQPPQRFDAVIGADGVHSPVRRLAFGDEARFIHHLGPYAAIWDLPADATAFAPGAGFMYAHPGRSVMVERGSDGAPARAFLSFGHLAPGTVNRHDADEVVQTMHDAFSEDRWRSGEIIDTLPRAEDLYFDTVSQIRMDRWSSGRVALVGDAAYAPAFPSGQATSAAISGAFVLAQELSRVGRPEPAYAAYERRMRDYIDRAQ